MVTFLWDGIWVCLAFCEIAREIQWKRAPRRLARGIWPFETATGCSACVCRAGHTTSACSAFMALVASIPHVSESRDADSAP